MAHVTPQTSQLTCVLNPCSGCRFAVEFTIVFTAYFRPYQLRPWSYYSTVHTSEGPNLPGI